MEVPILQDTERICLAVPEDTLAVFSRELHDNVGQLLSTAKIFLALTEQMLDVVPPPFRTACEILAKATSEVRLLARCSNQEWVTQFDLKENLKLEAERINRCGQITLMLHIPNKPIPLPAEAQVSIFRIIQEGIQNIFRHACANSIEICVTYLEQSITITISDNGCGFSEEQLNSKCGIGVLNMRQRAKVLKGLIAWKSIPGCGTEVTVSIPL